MDCTQGADFQSYAGFERSRDGIRIHLPEDGCLTSGKPEMTIEHNLKNTGRQPIRTNVYDHNFLVLDKATTGIVISLPFEIKTSRHSGRGNSNYPASRSPTRRAGESGARVFPIEGFGEIRRIMISGSRTEAGVGMQSPGPAGKPKHCGLSKCSSVEPSSM
jgi:hypothetical protein